MGVAVRVSTCTSAFSAFNFAPYLWTVNPVEMQPAERLRAPSGVHWFGTERQRETWLTADEHALLERDGHLSALR